VTRIVDTTIRLLSQQPLVGTISTARVLEVAEILDTSEAAVNSLLRRARVALETGITIEGPSGTVKMDPATHHTIRNAYLARPKDRVWEILQTFPNQFPSDTGGACDLIKSPRTNKQFTPQV